MCLKYGCGHRIPYSTLSLYKAKTGSSLLDRFIQNHAPELAEIKVRTFNWRLGSLKCYLDLFNQRRDGLFLTFISLDCVTRSDLLLSCFIDYHCCGCVAFRWFSKYQILPSVDVQRMVIKFSMYQKCNKRQIPKKRKKKKNTVKLVIYGHSFGRQPAL